MQQKYAALRHQHHYTIGTYTISALNLLVVVWCFVRDREDIYEVKIQKEDILVCLVGMKWKDILKHVIFDNWIHNIYWAFATCIDISIYGKDE